MSTGTSLHSTPIGQLLIVSDGEALTEVRFVNEPEGEVAAKEVETLSSPARSAGPLLTAVRDQLDAYFSGHSKEFDLPIRPDGTPFQKRVWAALQEIPYGKTVSYGELSQRLGDPEAIRAVGAANGQNPIPIIIPCHRVIGADGSLVGYGGGLARKRALLELETGIIGLPF